MASQIVFFEKSKCDYSNLSISATASQGAESARYVLNRNNTSAWITTGSVDADNSWLEVNMGDLYAFSEIILVDHNFKSFLLEYWTGTAWSTLFDTTNCSENTTNIPFARVEGFKIRITVRGTQKANEDKKLCQLIATNRLGQLVGWPIINDPVHGQNKRINKMLSGKSAVGLNVGGFTVELGVKNWNVTADLDLVERLYFEIDAFLVWLCGGDENQFSSKRIGYRRKDFYLVKTANDYKPEYVGGIYSTGLNLKIKLIEVA